MGGVTLWTERRKPSFHFLPRFSEEVMAVLAGGGRGIQGRRSPGGEDTGGAGGRRPLTAGGCSS